MFRYCSSVVSYVYVYTYTYFVPTKRKIKYFVPKKKKVNVTRLLFPQKERLYATDFRLVKNGVTLILIRMLKI
jgi:hypothetical protein